MERERLEGTRWSWEPLASGCTGPYSPIGGLSALQTVPPSLAITMPKVEMLNPRRFPKSCPESGTRCAGQVENFFHSTGKSMSQYFPLRGKNFSLFSAPSIPEKLSRVDIAHGTAIPHPSPRFGTRIAKAGV